MIVNYGRSFLAVTTLLAVLVGENAEGKFTALIRATCTEKHPTERYAVISNSANSGNKIKIIKKQNTEVQKNAVPLTATRGRL